MTFGKTSVLLNYMGNTVGSREVEKLNKEQEQILIGKLLGDGCIETNGFYPRLKIDHCQMQKEYVFWLYQKFSLISGRSPTIIGQFNKKYNKTYYNCRFATKSLQIFKCWQDLFYKGKRKIVPENVSDLLSELSLAIWYMDDGYRRRDCKGVYLCTSAFRLSEQKILQKALMRNFSLKSTLHYVAGNVKIYIPAECAMKFCNIIRKYVIPSFSYKLL